MKVYVFTATCQQHGTNVIAVLKHKPTLDEQKDLLTDWVNMMRSADRLDRYSEEDTLDFLEEYSTTDFDITEIDIID